MISLSKLTHYFKILPKHLVFVLKHLWKNRFGYCNVCGRYTFFYCHDPAGIRGSMLCLFCLSRSRNRHLAKVLLEKVGPGSKSLRSLARRVNGHDLDIYEACACGSLNRYLKRLKGYQCSEYYEGVELGSLKENSVRCENLECLSFPDNSFDVVITEDIFEHIREPGKAWLEVRRVLKPGGYHIFTVPFNNSKKTITRVEIRNGYGINVLPPRYHGDYLRDQGILVYTDFGNDLFDQLSSIGLPTETFFCALQDANKNAIYDSQVFCSKKKVG
jgi:SAM-dependent methyltransferase